MSCSTAATDRCGASIVGTVSITAEGAGGQEADRDGSKQGFAGMGSDHVFDIGHHFFGTVLADISAGGPNRVGRVVAHLGHPIGPFVKASGRAVESVGSHPSFGVEFLAGGVPEVSDLVLHAGCHVANGRLRVGDRIASRFDNT